jgi:hypothetical protein
MSERPGKARWGAWLKRISLLVTWFFLFLMLVRHSVLNGLQYEAFRTGSDFAAPKNQTGYISYVSWDPNHNCRPVHFLSCSNLNSENGRLGAFKTAAKKVVKVQDLELGFHRYSASEPDQQNTQQNAKGLADIGPDLDILISGISRRLTIPGARLHIESPDLSNVSEIHIGNLNYRLLYDGSLLLGVQCKKAAASLERSELALRGHVTITAADGGVLECNHALWDLDNDLFKIEGVYVLNRNGVRTSGRNIGVDARLHPCEVRNAKSIREEASPWFTRLP